MVAHVDLDVVGGVGVKHTVAPEHQHGVRDFPIPGMKVQNGWRSEISAELPAFPMPFVVHCMNVRPGQRLRVNQEAELIRKSKGENAK